MVEELVFRQTAQPLNIARLIKRAPLTGRATRILIHMPAGCHTLVEVFLNYKRHQVFPYGHAGLALDDATESFLINQECVKGDPFEILIINHDSVNEHSIVATLQLEGDKK